MKYLSWIYFIQHFWMSALGSAALVLSVINGLALLRNYLRDKPKLSIEAIYPEVYQWWFSLTGGTHDSSPTRAYGFLVYVDIANSGLRKVQLQSWRLEVQTQLGKIIPLQPLNMPDVEFLIGDHRKFLPVLGQKGAFLNGDTLVDSGCSISGTAFFRHECYGGAGWDPVQVDGKIPAKFCVTDVFGGKASLRMQLRPKSVEELQRFAPEMMESIQKIHRSASS